MENWSAYRTPSAAESEGGLGLVCLGVGAQSGPVRTVRGRTLDHHAAVIITEGSGWYDGERSLAVVAPALIWLFPGQRHGYGPTSSWTEHWLLFSGPAALAYEDLGLLRRNDPVTALPPSALGAVTRLSKIAELPEPRMGAQLAVWLHHLIGATDPIEAGEQDSVLQRLRHEPLGPASIEAHAGALGMSREMLRQHVQRACGLSPKRVQLLGRMNRAKIALAETDTSIARVADALGYDDDTYFSRLFRREVGITPSDFRRSYRRR